MPGNGPGAQTNDNGFASTVVASLETWNKVVVDGAVAAPTNLVDGWTNKGEFLHVRTLDLAPIFSEVRAAQQKAIEQEDKNLEEVARALVASIQANGQIPNPNVAATSAGGWAAMAQNFTSLSSDDLLNAFGTNPATQRRLYLSGNLTNYIQNQNGGSFSNVTAGWPTNSFPTSLFFVLVSSSKEDLSLTCASGSNLGAADVDWLKNWVKKPDFSGTFLADNLNVLTWTNRGEFLHVKAVDLRGSFKKVSLIDYASPPVSAIVNSLGSGYQSPSVDSLQVGATYRFFTVGDTNRTLPINTTGQPVGFNKSVILRSAVHTNYSLDDPAVVGETQAKFTLTLPGVPLWEISNLGAQPMPLNSNEKTFYVLSGSVLSLYDDLTNKIMSLPINSDATFEYFSGTWSQKN
ncbi:hypothetical protein EBX31_13665 [bacterium]|nr:hypothetical protein [bacterium]